MEKGVSFPEKNQTTDGSVDASVERVGTEGVANLEGVEVEVGEASDGTEHMEEGFSSMEENQSVENDQLGRELVERHVRAKEGVLGSMAEAPLAVSLEKIEDGSLEGVPNPGGVAEICNETEIRDEGVVCEEGKQSTVESVLGCDTVDGHVQSMEGILDPGEQDVVEEGSTEAPVDVVIAGIGIENEGMESLPNSEIVQVGVVEINDGAKVVEKGVSCQDKSVSMVNDAVGHDSVDGRLQATEAIVGYRDNGQDQAEVAVRSTEGEKDMGEGLSLEIGQGTVLQLMGEETDMGDRSMVDSDHDRDHEASVLQTASLYKNKNIQEEDNSVLDSISVDDSKNFQADDVRKDSNPADPVEAVQPQVVGMEIVVGDGPMIYSDQEISVLQASLVDTSQNIHDEGNTALDSVPVDDTVSHHADHVTDPVVEAEAQVMGRKTEVDKGSMRNVDQDRDHEASLLQTSLVDTNKKIQQEGNTALDLVPVDDTICHQADRVMTDPNPDDTVVEVLPQVMGTETEVGVGLLTDGDQGRVHEASVLETSLVETNQSIQEEGDTVLVSAPVGGSKVHQADCVTKDPNPADSVVEVQPQLMGGETEVVDGSMMDGREGRDHEASVSQTSLVENSQNIEEDGDTVLKSVHVNDTINQQADPVTIDPNPANPVVELQPQVVGDETEVGDGSLMDVDRDRDHKASVSQTSIVDTNQNIPEESDTTLESVPADDPIDHQADHVKVDPNLADPVVEQPQVIGRETEVGDGSMEDVDQDRDHKASVLQMPLVETNQNIQEGGNAVLDSIPVDSTLSHQADHVTKDPNPAYPVVEARHQVMSGDAGETEVGDGSMMDGSEDRDHEASVSQKSLVETSQNIQEDGDTVLNSVHVNDTINQQADPVTTDPNPTNPVVEVQPQVASDDTVVGDGTLMDVDLDRDHEASVSQMSFVDTNQNIPEESDTTLESVPVDDPIDHQADHVKEDPNLADPVVEQPQVVGRETEVGDGPMEDVDQDRDHKASVLQMPLVETNQNIQEGGNAVLDSIPVDSTLSHQADHVTKDPNPAYPVVEARRKVMCGDAGETEVGDGSMMDGSEGRDHEASVSQKSLVETSQNIQEDGDTVLNSVHVNDTINQQADPVTTDPNPANPVVEVQSQVVSDDTVVGDGMLMDVDLDRDHEASVSQMSFVDTNQNIPEESDTTLESVPVDDPIDHQADHVKEDPNLADPVVEQPQVVGRETEVGDGPMEDVDQDRDHKASILQMPLVETNQNIQEGGNAVLDSIPVDSTLSHQADHVTKDPNPAYPVVEARLQVMSGDAGETEVGDGSMMDGSEGRDHEASVSQKSLVETSQNIQEDGDTVLNSVHVNDTINQQADPVKTDPNPANPVVEVQPQVVTDDTVVGDGTLMDVDLDRDHEASVSQTSFVDANQNIPEESDTTLESVPVDDPIDHQADHVKEDPNLAYLVVEEQPQVIGRETEVGDGSMVDVDQDRDHKVSVLQMPLVETNQNIQEEGNAVLDSIPVDGTLTHQADHVTKDPNPAYPVVEARPQVMRGETEVGDGSMIDFDQDRDHEGCISQMSLVDTNQDFQEEGKAMLDSMPFDDTMSHQADHVTKDPNPADLVVEVPAELVGGETEVGDGSMVDGDEDRDQEASVSQMSLADTNQNIQKEGDTVLDSVLSDNSISHQADHVTKDSNPAYLVVEVRPQAIGMETVVSVGSEMGGNQNRDQKASVSKMSLLETNQNIQEEGNTVLNSIPVDNNINHQADCVTEDPSLAYLVVEVQNPDSHPVNKNLITREDIITAELDGLTTAVAEAENGVANSVSDGPMDSRDSVTTYVGLAETGVELEAPSADTHPVDGSAVDRGDIAKVDVNPAVELQSGGTQLIDGNPNGKGDVIRVVSCSVVETEDADTGSLDEKLMEIGDIVIENSNSVMETSASKASELSEIQTVVSQGKESVDFLLGANKETEAQSVGSLVDGSLGANAHEVVSSLGGSQNMDMESEVMKKDTSPLDPCCEEIELSQELETKQEITAPGDMGNVIVDEGTDGERMVQVEEEELLKGTEEQVAQCVAIRTGISVMENNQHAIYYMPPLDKANFSISDLVWGKVKSHPWWPGQIFDPSDASEMALKHQKKDNFLVAYFGDKTFAWCDESQLKPFHAYFSQMEKQSSSDTFVNAVDDILVEVSRRVELVMTCTCLPEESHASIKYQKVENAGIRKGNATSVLDRSLIMNYFQPDRLLEYIEALAQFPNGGVNRLELVMAQSQLKAFYHSKGYPELPVFTLGGGLMENVAEISPSDDKRSGEDIVEHFPPSPSDLVAGKGKLRSREKSLNKRKHVLEDGRKEKSMSELTVEENVHLANGGKSDSGVKAAEKSILSSSGKKRAAVDSDSADSGRRKRRTLDSFGDIGTRSPSPTVTSSFKIGEFIRRAASQLTGAPPILKCHGETFQKSVPQADCRRGDVAGFDVLPYTPVENRRTKISFSEDYTYPNEMLSQLCLAARDPMKGYSFVSVIVAFFTGFRNSCVSSSSEDKKHVEKRKRGRPKKVNTQSASSDMSTPDHMKDSYWSDMILQNKPRKKLLSNGLKRKLESHMGSQKKRKSAREPSLSLPSGPMPNSEQQLQVGAVSPNTKHAFVAERSIISVEEKIVDECMPTALILSFNNSNSLPSETDLIRIFSRYGPLKEAETDVLRKTNRAKVVFKRRADAEIAFSSAGKYSIFGPGLLSYRLKYLPSTPNSLPHTSPQDKHDAAPITTPQDNNDAAPITPPHDRHDPAPITTPQDNHDAPPITTPQDKYDAAPIEGCNFEVTDQAERGIVSDTIQVEAVGKETSE